MTKTAGKFQTSKEQFGSAYSLGLDFVTIFVSEIRIINLHTSALLSKGENIVKWIKGQRISWLGPLERMEGDRMPKTSSHKNWKERDEEEDPGKDGEKK
jgi:hypothetical protein